MLLDGSLHRSCLLGVQNTFWPEIVTIITYSPLFMWSFILARSWSYIFHSFTAMRSKLGHVLFVYLGIEKEKLCTYSHRKPVSWFINNELDRLQLCHFSSFVPIQVQMVTWMMQPTTSLPCSHHVTAVLTSPSTTTSPPPLTPLIYRWSSTWS